eukprot:SAG22_NODE_245_length_13962_cov_11.954555_5_plen_205_part_00
MRSRRPDLRPPLRCPSGRRPCCGTLRLRYCFARVSSSRFHVRGIVGGAPEARCRAHRVLHHREPGQVQLLASARITNYKMHCDRILPSIWGVVGRFDPAQTCEKPTRCASGAPDHSWALSPTRQKAVLAAYEIWTLNSVHKKPDLNWKSVHLLICPYFIRRQMPVLGHRPRSLSIHLHLQNGPMTCIYAGRNTSIEYPPRRALA